MAREKKTKQIAIRLEETIHDQLYLLCDVEATTISQLVRKLIITHLKKHHVK